MPILNHAKRVGTVDTGKIKIREIPIGDIREAGNIRKTYSQIPELAASIRSIGLNTPITVYKQGDDYCIKTGHRCYNAYKLLNEENPDRFHSIPCIVSDDNNIGLVQLIENVQRVDLTASELFDAMTDLRKQGMKNAEIASFIGKSVGYVDNIFSGIKDIISNPEILDVVKTHTGVSFSDVAETRGLPTEQRIDLLTKKGKGEIPNRRELSKAVKDVKEQSKEHIPETKTSNNLTKLTLSVIADVDNRQVIIRPKNTNLSTNEVLTLAKAVNKALLQTKIDGFEIKVEQIRG